MISQSSVAVATGCWNWDRRAARTTERSTISEGWGAQPLYLLSRAGERGGAKPPAPRHARGCFPASAPSCLAAVFTQLALLGAAVPMAPPLPSLVAVPLLGVASSPRLWVQGSVSSCNILHGKHKAEFLLIRHEEPGVHRTLLLPGSGLLWCVCF